MGEGTDGQVGRWTGEHVGRWAGYIRGRADILVDKQLMEWGDQARAKSTRPSEWTVRARPKVPAPAPRPWDRGGAQTAFKIRFPLGQFYVYRKVAKTVQ